MGHVKARIHQYHSGASSGDAITNGMLFARSLLRELGFESEIFGRHIDPSIANEVRPLEEFDDSDCDLLLAHFSMGIDHADWLMAQRSRKALVYHNITPAEFFSDDPFLAAHATLGRQQLASWRGMFEFSIADSEFNAAELREVGFPRVHALPLLIDAQSRLRMPWCEKTRLRYESAPLVLFVGRIAENKRQLDLVRAFARTQLRRRVDARLVLVGSCTSSSYLVRIKETIALEDLDQQVEFAGKLSDAELLGLYRAATVFTCMSEHEGFCVPLVEAMCFDVPIVATLGTAITTTLDGAGVGLNGRDIDEFAAAIDLLAEEPLLRRSVILGQRRRLEAFGRTGIARGLAEQLAAAGFDPRFVPEAEPTLPQWRIEGPFDSSYSLAILNRQLGRALIALGKEVRFYSTEGPGDFAPSMGFLTANPDIAARIALGAEPRPDVVLRNLYPPRTTRLEGVTNTFALYGWEESTFPPEWAARFNERLQGITVMSHYVKKVLRDSGVSVPITVAGVGVDHVLSVKPEPLDVALPVGFRFLHVSSCFPRKGVDVMLDAFGRAFSGRRDVALIIKTFPNPHNDVERQVEERRSVDRRFPEVLVLNEDFTEGRMVSLYRACHALVAPSRGEGFGLPMAEAMLLGVPVITTGYGGQADFATAASAWLVDYRFAYARSHLSLPGSVWVEPVVDSLVARLNDVAHGSAEARQIRIEAARRSIVGSLKWSDVARRVAQSCECHGVEPQSVDRRARIGLVTTWNVRCGIAAYSEYLVAGWGEDDIVVLADSRPPMRPDGTNVSRCWSISYQESLERVEQEALARQLDLVVIQYNFGFFSLDALARLIGRLEALNCRVVLFLHSTQDVDRPGLRMSLSEIAPALRRAARVAVHSCADLNRLKQMGVSANAMLFPHGVFPMRAQAAPDKRAGMTIASFGFALPHKGLEQLLFAMSLLRRRLPQARLLMLNSQYPASASEAEIARCRQLIGELEMESIVVLDTDYHSEESISERLSECAVIVFPYQETNESSSAAVRMALSSPVPVVCTPLAIFEDVADVVEFCEGKSPFDLAATLERVLSNPGLYAVQIERRRDWLEALSWPRLSTRLMGLCRGLVSDSASKACTSFDESAPIERVHAPARSVS